MPSDLLDTEHASSEAPAMSDAGAHDTVSATQISGTASYRERMALRPTRARGHDRGCVCSGAPWPAAFSVHDQLRTSETRRRASLCRSCASLCSSDLRSRAPKLLTDVGSGPRIRNQPGMPKVAWRAANARDVEGNTTRNQDEHEHQRMDAALVAPIGSS